MGSRRSSRRNDYSSTKVYILWSVGEIHDQNTVLVLCIGSAGFVLLRKQDCDGSRAPCGEARRETAAVRDRADGVPADVFGGAAVGAGHQALPTAVAIHHGRSDGRRESGTVASVVCIALEASDEDV